MSAWRSFLVQMAGAFSHKVPARVYRDDGDNVELVAEGLIACTCGASLCVVVVGEGVTSVKLDELLEVSFETDMVAINLYVQPEVTADDGLGLFREALEDSA